MGISARVSQSSGGGGSNSTGTVVTTKTTTAINTAITAVSAAGGGTVQLLAGTYVTNGVPMVLKSDVSVVGQGRAVTLVQRTGSDSIVCDVSGTHQATTTTSQVLRARLENFGLDGGGNQSWTQPLLRCFYTADDVFDLYFYNNYGCAVHGVEFWDSVFINHPRFENVGGTDGTKPAVLLESSNAASGMGNSDDNCNNINFDDPVFETFRDGAVWVQRNLGSANCHTIGLGKAKMESTVLRGTFIDLETVLRFSVTSLFMNPSGFDSGFSTPVNLIRANNCQGCVFRNTSAEINNGATVRTMLRYEGGGYANKLDHFGAWANSDEPTVGLIEFTGGGGAWAFDTIGYWNWPSGSGPTNPVMVGNPDSLIASTHLPYWNAAVTDALVDQIVGSPFPDNTVFYRQDTHELCVRESDGTFRTVTLT